MPFNAVIFRKTKQLGLRFGAGKTIKNTKSINEDDAKNAHEPSGPDVKEKRLEVANISSGSVNERMEIIKSVFNDLQMALPSTGADKIQKLKEDVLGKLCNIFEETKFTEPSTLAAASAGASNLPHANATVDDEDISVSKKINGVLQTPANIERAMKSFRRNKRKNVIVYLKGSCNYHGPDGASAGAGVWFGVAHPMNLALKVPGPQTSSNAEIYAAVKAIECVKLTGLARINIRTDSTYVVMCAKSWIANWMTNNWKTKSGLDVKNKELLLKLHELIQTMEAVTWNYIKPSDSVWGSEEATKLAWHAADTTVSVPWFNNDLNETEVMNSVITSEFKQSLDLLLNHSYDKYIDFACGPLKDCCQHEYNMMSSVDVMDICYKSTLSKDIWDRERKYRITGSRCYALYTYALNQTPDWNSKCLKYYNKDNISSNKFIRHGIINEPEAKKLYQSMHTKCTIFEPGLIVSKDNPWLGYSADGVIFEDGVPTKLLEIKCPYRGKTNTIKDAIHSCHYITKVNGMYTLRPKHVYYGQIQLGMFILNLETTDFCVYSSYDDSMYTIHVKRDEEFIKSMITSLKQVFFENMLHTICIDKQ